MHQRTDNDLNTLRRVLSQKEQESRQQQSRLESRIQELEKVQQSFRDGLSTVSSAMDTNSSTATIVHPPAPIPPPPPPPPLKAPPPPPPPSTYTRYRTESVWRDLKRFVFLGFPTVHSSGPLPPPPPAPPMSMDQGGKPFEI